MVRKSIPNTDKSDFRSSIPNYSDDKILAILKKRKQYQPEAAELAISEAIKRGLINSEQDLFSEEFSEEPTASLLFPQITDNLNKEKTRKSISRILLLAGVIPVIWGVLQIIKSNLGEGILLILLGAVWIYASAQLMRGFQIKMVNLLFVLLAASVAYSVKLLAEMKGLVIMDYFIPVVLILFVVYGLVFIRRLK